MDDEWISVIDVANQHGIRRATVFKVLKRRGIQTRKERSSSNGNQAIAYITQEEYRLVIRELSGIAAKRNSEEDESEDADKLISPELGVFYLIQLEPSMDPGRFKVGFAASLAERLRQSRCFAPYATVVRSWPCRRLWEKTAIDSVSAGCERLHTEVFRSAALDEVVVRCEQFFALMPPV